LYEGGQIAVITGPNSYQPTTANPQQDTTQYVRIGLLNPNMTGTTRGYFIGQVASGVAGQPLDDTNPSIIVFKTIPPPGTRYVFTPVTN
jgi:hypothetical protein